VSGRDRQQLKAALTEGILMHGIFTIMHLTQIAQAIIASDEKNNPHGDY